MAHPKAVLLAMLGDERKEARQETVHLVPEARQRKTSNQLRSCNASFSSLDAQTYIEMADVRKYARDSRMELVAEQLHISVPYHTQSTE